MQLAKRRWDQKIHPLTVVRWKFYDSAQIKEQDEEAKILFLYVFMYREFWLFLPSEMNFITFRFKLSLGNISITVGDSAKLN